MFRVLGVVFLGAVLPPGLCAQAQTPPELQNPQTTVTVHSDSQEKNQGIYILRGHVEVTYQQMKLTADEATYDEVHREVVARGKVVFTDPQVHLEADEAHYNLQTQKGWFQNGHGYVRTHVRSSKRVLVSENPLFFQAARVDRLDPWTYQIQRGSLTTCDCEKTGWSVATRRARVELGHEFVARDATFHLLRIPFFYFPVLADSIAKKPRKTGFLLPHIGTASQKGFIVGDGFYWAINPSADLLLGVENYSLRGLARRALFEARPSETSELAVNYFGVNDHGIGPLRQYRAPGNSLQAVGEDDNVGYGFRGAVDVDYVNSLAFRLAFAESFAQAVSSETRQSGFLTRNWDAYSLSLFASRYESFFSATEPGNSVVIRKTPSVEFSGMDQQLGKTPFFFSFETSAGEVGRSEPGTDLPTLSERLDFHPEITLRAKSFWGFHLTPTAGFRSTYYGSSLLAGQAPLTRLMGEFSLDLRPPSFEKVYGRTFWGRRFKHVIEPDIRYKLVRARNAQDITDVVLYDDMDIFTETNEIEYSLTNTILSRKDASDSSGNTPQAHELISLRLTQKYFFDPTFGGALAPGVRNVFDPTISLTGFAFAQGRRLSPVVSVLKLAPSSNYDTELRTDLNPSGGGVLNAGITSNLHRGSMGLSFTDFFINKTASLPTSLLPNAPLSLLPSFNMLRTVATFGNISRKGFSGAFGLDYNFAQQIVNGAVGQLSYNFGCFALDMEYRRFSLGPIRRENLFRVALSLANVGTFGNLKPRERLY